MRYVNPLSKTERVTLTEMMRHHQDFGSQMRAHGILLSASGYAINAIADIYHVHRNTVCCWIDQWEQVGVMGLLTKERSGRPKKLTQDEQVYVKKLLQENPRSPRKVAKILLKEKGKRVCVATIKRIARASKLVWKRIKKTVKGKRDEAAFIQMHAELRDLHQQEKEHQLAVYYFDESGFSLDPVVPYAWQPKGEYIEIPVSRSRRINVLGFLSKHHPFESFLIEGRVDTEVVVACMDAFSLMIKKPTWIILDNAPQHTSKAFKNHLSAWEERGLFIKYLPAYSPELNLIEIAWRFIKYLWLPFSAYESFKHLKNAVEDILKNMGTKYQITFV